MEVGIFEVTVKRARHGLYGGLKGRQGQEDCCSKFRLYILMTLRPNAAYSAIPTFHASVQQYTLSGFREAVLVVACDGDGDKGDILINTPKPLESSASCTCQNCLKFVVPYDFLRTWRFIGSRSNVQRLSNV